jgi:hypothetical protein
MANPQKGLDEAKERLAKILRGAFSSPPTHLKDIPKKRAKKRDEQPSAPQKLR